MDNNVRQSNENESSVSFRDIFRYLKRAAPIVIVFIIVAVIIGCIAGGIISSANTVLRETSVYVQLLYSGADAGLEPNGQILTVQDFKSINKVNQVLKENGLNYDPAEVKSAISITSYYNSKTLQLFDSAGDDQKKLAELLASNNVQPTNYKLSISNDKIAGSKPSELEKILNALVALNRDLLFQVEPNEDFLPSEMYVADRFSGRTHIAQYISVDQEYARLANYIDLVSNGRVDIGMTSSDLTSISRNMTAIRSMLINFENYLLNNAVTTDLASTIAYLEGELSSYKLQLAQQTSEQDSLAAMIKAYSVNKIIITADGKITEESSYVIAQLNTMYSRQSELAYQIALTNKEMENITSKLDKYKSVSSNNTVPTAEHVAEADKQFNNILASMTSVTANIEGIMDASHAGRVSSGFKTTASITQDTKLSGVSWLVILALAIVIGAASGLVAYHIIDKKVKGKKAAKLAVAAAEDNKLESVLDEIDSKYVPGEDVNPSNTKE